MKKIYIKLYIKCIEMSQNIWCAVDTCLDGGACYQRLSCQTQKQAPMFPLLELKCTFVCSSSTLNLVLS